MVDTWRVSAACRGLDPQIFYVNDEDGEAPAICGNCNVRPECLEHAITNREKEGFWGGMNQRQRRSIIRARRNARNAAKKM